LIFQCPSSVIEWNEIGKNCGLRWNCPEPIDVGANGRCSDGGIFRNSSLKLAIENGFLNLPKNGYFVADDAFPLTKYMMKPYSRRKLSKEHYIFNYRLSRARRIVENAFGILVWRFIVFLRPIELQPSTVDKVIWSACVLHNRLQMTNSNAYFPSNAVDTEDLNTGTVTSELWRDFTSGLPSASQLGSNNYKNKKKL